MSKEDLDFIDFFSAMDLNRTDANKMDPLSLHSDTNMSPLQLETISETGPAHFHPSSSFNQMLEVQSPQSYVPTSPMNIGSSGCPSSSFISTTGFDMSSFGSSRQAPMGSVHGPSALTRQLKGNKYGVPSSQAINQPMSPMLTYDNMGRQMPGSSSMPHYSPMNNFEFPLTRDQMLSKQLDFNEYGMKAVENQDLWGMSSSSGSYSTGVVQIPTVNHRRASSIASSLGVGDTHRHEHYRRPPSLTLGHSTPDLILSSPSLPVVTMPSPSSLISELSPVSTAAGLTAEQVPAAQAIVQFITEHPNTKIPAALITRELVETSTDDKGYCLIGNCGLVRAGQKADPHYNPSMDKEYRKRIDHLQDHVKDKHFNSRPFTCNYGSCSATFAREPDLKRHGEIHLATKIVCPDLTCGKSYTRPDNLGRHIKTKHPHLAHLPPVNSHVRHSTTPY